MHLLITSLFGNLINNYISTPVTSSPRNTKIWKDFRRILGTFISGSRFRVPEVFVQKPEPARKLKIATRNSTTAYPPTKYEVPTYRRSKDINYGPISVFT